MPNDICLNAGSETQQSLTPLMVLIAVLLIVIAAIAIGGAGRTSDTGAQPASLDIEDWHGNVKRSHWNP